MRNGGAGAFACQLALAAALFASAQTGGTVQGRVISSLQGEPVANALVTLRELQTSGGAPPQTYICQTGPDGRFSIAGMAPGIYDPRPSKQGFETHPPERYATAHDFPPVTVEADKPVTGLELRLIPDSVIAGRLLDGDGDPVRNAEVEVQQYAYIAGKRQLRTMHQVQTNDRGEYRIYYLAPGRYYVHGESNERRYMNGPVPLPALSLAGAYYPGVTEVSRATELQAQPGAELDGIDIHLLPEKRYSIRGKLPAGETANNGHGVRLEARTPGNANRQPRYSVNFTRDGYEIWDVAPGSYVVIEDSVNRSHPEERLYGRQQVDVIDHDVDGVDLTYSPAVQVKGVVKVAGAAPLDLEKTPLLLRGDEFIGQQQAKIAPDGTFASPRLAPGNYQLGIAGRSAYVKSVRLGDRELPDRRIDAEHAVGELTVLVSADFGHVEGTVTDEAGKPVYDAVVTLIPDQSRSDWQDKTRDMLTSPAGKFSFSTIEPGEYKVYAWLGAEPGAPLNADFRKPYEASGVAVKVEANGRSAVELKVIVLMR